MVSFKLFAGTDVGLRDNNEDNFTVCPDLTQNEWMMPADHQQVIPLGERGCLMVVADGMGGQNAGEVASAIAVETVQSMFAPETLSDKVLSKPSSIKDYLKKVVSKADSKVKEYSKEHPEAEGLGSTIVMVLVVGNKAYVAWLGDSRAYAFIPNQSIKRLSKDHSYVQQLVDEGKLTDIEAMIHPNSNIITRSLGDTSQKAKAEVEEYPLEDGEIILLCSDGLCGVCTDDEIAGVLTEEANDLQVSKEQLTELALDNGGSDNITIAMMQIVLEEEKGEKEEKPWKSFNKNIFLGVFVALIVILIGAFARNKFFPKTQTPSIVQTTNTTKIQVKSDTSKVVESHEKQQAKSHKEVQKLQLQQIKDKVQQNLEVSSPETTSSTNPEVELTESPEKGNKGGLPTANNNKKR